MGDGVLAFDTTQVTSPGNYSVPQPGQACHSLARGQHPPALAFPQNLSGTQCAESVEVAPAMQSRNPTALAFQPRIARKGDAAPCVAIPEVAWALQRRDSKGVDSDTKEGHLIRAGFAVRRLTPRECERLQGFPDDWTAVPFRGRPAADGPRYKALGNSMAVNVMRWLGERIALVEEWAPLNA